MCGIPIQPVEKSLLDEEEVQQESQELEAANLVKNEFGCLGYSSTLYCARSEKAWHDGASYGSR